jgi:uncharacterized protein (DUF1501 family)
MNTHNMNLHNMNTTPNTANGHPDPDNYEIAPGITRRSFMNALGLGATAVVTVPLLATPASAASKGKAKAKGKAKPKTEQATVSTAPTSAPTSTPRSAANGDGILVVVTLYGGNDGLNTVVPYGDPAYVSARQDVAIATDQVLKLDGTLGLHPEMKGLKALFDAKQLAVVLGVGYPQPNRSHFRSMDIWQTARPAEISNIGWLGRWHDATGPDALRMINIGASLPRYMNGTKGSGASLNPGRLTLPGGATGARIITSTGQNADNSAALGPLGARIAASNADLVRVNKTYAPLLTTGAEAAGGGNNLEGEGANTLSRDLQEVARLVKAGAPARVYGVSLGGFDTHATELEQHARLLSYVDNALSGFMTSLAGDVRGQKVTVMVHSEFGRRVSVNGSDGTDHGTAAPMFVLGSQVKGGLYGQQPSLSDLDQGDLKFTTDFRTVYSALLGSVLGMESTSVLGGTFAPIPLL